MSQVLVFSQMFPSQVSLTYVAHKFASKGFIIRIAYNIAYLVDIFRLGKKEKHPRKSNTDLSSRLDRHAIDFMCTEITSFGRKTTATKMKGCTYTNSQHSRIHTES